MTGIVVTMLVPSGSAEDVERAVRRIAEAIKFATEGTATEVQVTALPEIHRHHPTGPTPR